MSKKRSLKQKIVIGLLVVLSGVFVIKTADVTKEIMAMFLGSVGSVSLLTIIFFLAGMLQDSSIKEKIKPYAIVFSLFLAWIIILTLLRVIVKF